MILSPYKSSFKKNYINSNFYLVDNSPTSPIYFDIVSFPTYFGGGKNIIKFKGNGLGLKFGAPIDAEVLDVDGNVIYSEFSDFIDRNNNLCLSVYVYDYAVKGVGTVTLASEAAFSDPSLEGATTDTEIPQDQKNKFNLRWTRSALILPDARNNSVIEFAKGPTITAAQIITPFRAVTAYTSSLVTVVTSSNVNYVTTFAQGYDFDFGTTQNILDKQLNDLLLSPTQTSQTANTVPTSTRVEDYDILNGYKLLENTRFNTYIYTPQAFFKKEYTGGYFRILTTPRYRYPQIPSNTTQSIDLQTQFDDYSANIVKVLNSSSALIDRQFINKLSFSNSINNQTASFVFSDLKNFTSSLSYKPNDSTFITSSNVSQSYVEFTFDNIDPIGGQIYRIKSFYKLSGQTGDFKLLNDQLVKDVELLADPSRPNQTSYARFESEYYLIGHFTDIDQVRYDEDTENQDWNVYLESPQIITQYTTTTSSAVISDAVQLQPSASTQQNMLFTTKDYQGYSIDKIYTLTFNCALESGAELEIYGNSTSLISQQNILTVPIAFLKTRNEEKIRYSDSVNRFGKLIGVIKNTSSSTKNYGRVVFDFETDGSGIGRPLFRLKYNGVNNPKVWLSEISIKPYTLQGFNPPVIQYAVQVGDEFSQILSQSVDFKFEYYDYTGNQSEFISYLKDVKINLKAELPNLGCQTEINNFYFGGRWIRTIGNETITDSELTGSGFSFQAAFAGTSSAAGQNLNFWNANYYSRNTHNVAFTTHSTDYTTLTSYKTKLTSSWKHFDPSVEDHMYNTLYYDIDYPNRQDTSSIDGRYFTFGPACCIDRRDVNIQWSNFDASGGFSPTSPNLTAKLKSTTEALRRVRLIWPHYSGPTINNLFTENGGVYSVQFKVKHYASQSSAWFNTDSGSKLNVFIYNANLQNFGTSYAYQHSFLNFGGEYPPIQNIQTFTFDNNTQWIDSINPNYRFVRCEATLVQYGYPAQLVFEASGSGFTGSISLDANTGQWSAAGPIAFGGCIDDIKICKIGTTTDTTYIKPGSTGTSLTDQAATGGGGIDPGSG